MHSQKSKLRDYPAHLSIIHISSIRGFSRFISADLARKNRVRDYLTNPVFSLSIPSSNRWISRFFSAALPRKLRKEITPATLYFLYLFVFSLSIPSSNRWTSRFFSAALPRKLRDFLYLVVFSLFIPLSNRWDYPTHSVFSLSSCIFFIYSLIK